MHAIKLTQKNWLESPVFSVCFFLSRFHSLLTLAVCMWFHSLFAVEIAYICLEFVQSANLIQSNATHKFKPCDYVCIFIFSVNITR